MQADATTQPAQALIDLQTGRFAELLRQGMDLNDVLSLCRNMNAALAVVVVIAGFVFLLWGFYAFKSLVVLNAACLGGWVGYLLGHSSGSGTATAAVGAFVAAAAAWPLMKHAVAVMGALIGTVLGMTIWRTAGLDPHFAASGGGMGMIFFGMLSFILFRTSIMLFTSIQGAAMVMFGVLCVVYKLRLFDSKVMDAKLLVTPSALPMAIALAAVLGMLYQNNDTAKPAEPAAK